MKKEYSTAKALATAVAAFEFNNHSILRNPETVDGVGRYPNRQLMLNSLDGDVEHFTVTESHYQQADEIIQYLQQAGLMQTLAKGAMDTFLGSIIELLANPKVTNRDLGMLAWAPKLTKDFQKKDQVREISAGYEGGSRYIGSIGDKLVINFTLIESRYIKTMDCYAVYGYTEQDNLVFYWARDKEKIVTAGRLQGKVKAQNKDKFRNNACVTTLNYVKVL